MGLGGAKKRTKLAKDPNNTAWSNNSENFGHRMLTKSGWKPGTLLGAENAAQKDHLTAASASHIRVLLREDNMGLGADRKKANAETFGLNLFSGVLGRLNGKSEDMLAKEESGRRDVELRQWQVQRYGYMRFVKGGLLVGDKIEKKDKDGKAADEVESKALDAGDGQGLVESEGKSRKRKADVEGEGQEMEQKPKDSKKRKRDRYADVQEDAEEADPVDKKKRTKKDRKARKQDTKAIASAETSHTTSPEPTSKPKKRKSKNEPNGQDEANDKARRKEEKRARKEARRLRKEEKRQRKASKSTTPATTAANSESDPDSSAAEDARPAVAQRAAANFVGRNAVRQRYIQQKRMASMNQQSMNEIFMVKA